jgi:hypothetical protein
VAQDQKPFEKCNFFTPHLTFLGSTFFTAHSTVIFRFILLPFNSYKGLDVSFQEQKTESIYLNGISFLSFL